MNLTVFLSLKAVWKLKWNKFVPSNHTSNPMIITYTTKIYDVYNILHKHNLAVYTWMGYKIYICTCILVCVQELYRLLLSLTCCVNVSHHYKFPLLKSCPSVENIDVMCGSVFCCYWKEMKTLMTRKDSGYTLINLYKESS